jgi:hypothetical protein
MTVQHSIYIRTLYLAGKIERQTQYKDTAIKRGIKYNQNITWHIVENYL